MIEFALLLIIVYIAYVAMGLGYLFLSAPDIPDGWHAICFVIIWPVCLLRDIVLTLIRFWRRHEIRNR
jgi:hypothetical protein